MHPDDLHLPLAHVFPDENLPMPDIELLPLPDIADLDLPPLHQDDDQDARPAPKPTPTSPPGRPRPKGATDTTTPVTFRLPHRILEGLRHQAKQLGIGYQTLAIDILRAGVARP